jgi:hypothetical protein
VIPHAGGFGAPSSSPLAFPIAMVEAAFGALSMTATGLPEALRSSQR